MICYAPSGLSVRQLLEVRNRTAMRRRRLGVAWLLAGALVAGASRAEAQRRTHGHPSLGLELGFEILRSSLDSSIATSEGVGSPGWGVQFVMAGEYRGVLAVGGEGGFVSHHDGRPFTEQGRTSHLSTLCGAVFVGLRTPFRRQRPARIGLNLGYGAYSVTRTIDTNDTIFLGGQGDEHPWVNGGAFVEAFADVTALGLAYRRYVGARGPRGMVLVRLVLNSNFVLSRRR